MKKHKKCPFCGGEPKLESAGYRTNIYCQTCGSSSRLVHGSAQTIAAWSAWDRREGGESTPIYIIEFRPKGGKWQIFDMDGDRSRERAESYIPSNQVAYPDCEFRVVKYQRVEES